MLLVWCVETVACRTHSHRWVACLLVVDGKMRTRINEALKRSHFWGSFFWLMVLCREFCSSSSPHKKLLNKDIVFLPTFSFCLAKPLHLDKDVMTIVLQERMVFLILLSFVYIACRRVFYYNLDLKGHKATRVQILQLGLVGVWYLIMVACRPWVGIVTWLQVQAKNKAPQYEVPSLWKRKW